MQPIVMPDASTGLVKWHTVPLIEEAGKHDGGAMPPAYAKLPPVSAVPPWHRPQETFTVPAFAWLAVC